MHTRAHVRTSTRACKKLTQPPPPLPLPPVLFFFFLSHELCAFFRLAPAPPAPSVPLQLAAPPLETDSFPTALDKPQMPLQLAAPLFKPNSFPTALDKPSMPLQLVAPPQEPNSFPTAVDKPGAMHNTRYRSILLSFTALFLKYRARSRQLCRIPGILLQVSPLFLLGTTKAIPAGK